jgi:hypothetical protein
VNLISQIVYEHLRKYHSAIDAACAASLHHDCGVKVTFRDDASFTVELSPEVPPLQVYEYRNSGLIAYGFDPYKLPYVENMLSSADTPGNGQSD